MSNPPPPSEPPPPLDPTRIDRGPGADPTAPAGPTPPPPGTPQPQGPPQPPAGPPAFKPGVATPSYAPPPPPTGAFQPPTGAFQPPTGAFQAPSGYPPYQPAPPGKAPGGGRSGGLLLWVLIGVFAVLLCGGAGVAGVIAFRNATNDPTAGPTAAPVNPPAGQERPTPGAEPTSRAPGGEGTITFEVTGDGPATITYLREGSGNERVRNADLPWQTEVPKPNKAFVVNLTAIRTGGGTGKISCRVLVDGKELISRTSQGNFGSVFCIGLVPE